MERMNERECEDKREREDENAAGDAGLTEIATRNATILAHVERRSPFVLRDDGTTMRMKSQETHQSENRKKSKPNLPRISSISNGTIAQIKPAKGDRVRGPSQWSWLFLKGC